MASAIQRTEIPRPFQSLSLTCVCACQSLSGSIRGAASRPSFCADSRPAIRHHSPTAQSAYSRFPLNPVAAGILAFHWISNPYQSSNGATPASVWLSTRRAPARWSFDGSGRRNIEVEVATDGADTLRIECWHHGVKPINELDDWVKPWFDARLPNFYLHSITIRDATSHSKPSTLNRSDGSIVTFDYQGQRFAFFIDEPGDSIQAYHAIGRFYALAELRGC